MSSTPEMRLHQVAWPVTSLGYGRRLGLWAQGCHLGCGGCMSPNTWDPQAGNAFPVDTLATLALSLVESEALDGVTISGGEPTEQPESLEALLIALQPLRLAHVDLLLFTGQVAERLKGGSPQLLSLLDAVVAGPYQASSPGRGSLLASGNQELHTLSPLGLERYGDEHGGGRRRLQIAASRSGFSLVGIPKNGDLTRLEESLHVARATTDSGGPVAT